MPDYLKSAYEVALDRLNQQPQPQPQPLKMPTESPYVSDSKRLQQNKIWHSGPRKSEKEKRESETEHRNIYAVKSYAELLARVHAGQQCVIRNARFGYLQIADLGVSMGLNQTISLNEVPFAVLRDSRELQELCDRNLVEMEGIL